MTQEHDKERMLNRVYNGFRWYHDKQQVYTTV